MKFRLGYELRFEFVRPTPVIMMLQVHDTRASDLEKPDIIGTAPQVAMSPYMDTFGNRCCRLVAPAGEMKIWTDTVASDDGLPDRVAADASQVPVESLPDDALLYLLASRYCDSDLLSKVAWTLFAHIEPGWARVAARHLEHTKTNGACAGTTLTWLLRCAGHSTYRPAIAPDI